MTPREIVFVAAAILAMLVTGSLPLLGSRRGADSRRRAALLRQLAFGWAAVGLLMGWLVAGGFALSAGGPWWLAYRDGTLIVIVAGLTVWVYQIRAINRAANAT